MRKVKIDYLQEDMELARPIFDGKGNILLREGKKLKNNYIEKLKEKYVNYVYVRDEISEGLEEVEDLIKPETREEAKQVVGRVFSESKKDLGNGLNSLLFLKERYREVIENIVDQLLDNKNLMVSLEDIKYKDCYTFNHCINVGVLSLVLALDKGMYKSQMKDLAFGVFLHDLGKIFVPIEILNKKGSLEDEEFEIIKRHSEKGYEMVKKSKALKEVSALVIYEHHERFDGRGYPRGLCGEEISLFSRISAVADVYDALISDRPYRKGKYPHEAYNILESGNNEFDLDILSRFLKKVASYPVGTVLELSNGYIGIVKENIEGYSKFPVVKIISDLDKCPVKPFEIDLKESINVVVNRLLEEEEVQEIKKKIK